MQKWLFILFLMAGLGQMTLQAQRYPFRTYSIQEGLSESVVYDIAQDEEGYIWLATGYGLNRFDGVRFQNYFEEQGLNSSRTRAVYKDRQGRIWIGSEAGVNYWQADSIYSISELTPLQNTMVISIFQDRLGNMWFGTDGNGLWQLRNGSDLTQYSTTNGLANNRVRAIAEAPNGDLWFATRGGVTVLSNGNFRTYTIEDGLPANRIRDIKIDSAGTVWIGSRSGLVKKEGESFVVFDTSVGLIDNLIRTLSITKNGELWIGTEGGLSNFDGDDFSSFNTSSGLSNNMIYSSLIDREGNIWLGTYGGGVSLFLGNYIASYDQENGLPNNLVTTFTEDGQGRKWIGMYGGGIVALESGSFQDYGLNRQLPDDQIYKLFTDSQQRMWIGMREGLAKLEGQQLSVFGDEEFPFRKVRNILEASDGSFWISTYDDGIVHYKNNRFRQYNTESGLPNNTVLAAIESEDGAIWIATYGGVSRYRDGQFKNFSLQEGLPNNGVMNLLKDNEGRIWASTFGGIAWFDGERFQSITTDDGLPDRVCYFIEQSRDGFYWIGTTNGVVRFDGKSYLEGKVNPQEQPVFQIINKELGLVADELNLGAVYEDSEGRLWFGTVEGFSRFNPDLYKQNPAPPIVHIRGINASGREYEPGKEFTLSHQENYVEIFYTGINFTSPNQILYEYKLSGIDPDWQQTSARNIKYPSLPPGAYTFKVHARSLNGSWSPEVEEVNFHISAPFWMQWWFWVLVTLMVVGIIYLFYNYYRARKMVDIERMRVRIASDLHDDVGASLTEIALQSDFLQASDADSEFKQSLQQIGKQCRKIVSSLDDIVWSIDARNDTLGDLTDRMQDYILHTLEPRNMAIRYDFEHLNMDNKLPVEVKENLYLIFKEAVNNIAKYSNGDEVEIRMENQNGSFEFFITDNGDTGKSTKKTGHGLRNMEMRAKRIGANITIDTQDGFTIQVKGSLHSN